MDPEVANGEPNTDILPETLNESPAEIISDTNVLPGISDESPAEIIPDTNVLPEASNESPAEIIPDTNVLPEASNESPAESIPNTNVLPECSSKNLSKRNGRLRRKLSLEKKREVGRLRAAMYRSKETPEQRQARLESLKNRAARSRANETPEQRQARLEDLRNRAKAMREKETPEQRQLRLEKLRARSKRVRPVKSRGKSTELSVNGTTTPKTRKSTPSKRRKKNADSHCNKDTDCAVLKSEELACLGCGMVQFEESLKLCCANRQLLHVKKGSSLADNLGSTSTNCIRENDEPEEILSTPSIEFSLLHSGSQENEELHSYTRECLPSECLDVSVKSEIPNVEMSVHSKVI